MTDASGDIEQRADGYLVKVLNVLDEGEAFLARTSNGGTARFSLGLAADLARGDVVFISDHQYWVLPDTAWPDTNDVAIVRRIVQDGVLVEIGASIRLLPGQPIVPIDIGNTVLVNEIDGITRVLSETPVRFRNVGIDDEEVNEYIFQQSEDGPTFDSFGGYYYVRERAIELIEAQLTKRAKLLNIGARPVKGIIFTGPPGTGKTHLARIIAHESKATFFLVSGPSIVSKWVGDSEDTLRRIFDAAAKEERAIIFFDEIDSIAERRTERSHEASKRVVAQLLTLLGGFDQEDTNLVVIAATNRIEDIDDALLRPGRFDWEIHFDLPSASDRFEILSIGASRLQRIGELPIMEIAALTEGWSGARLNSLWTEAALLAATDNRGAISDQDLAEALERVSSRLSHDRRGHGNGS